MIEEARLGEAGRGIAPESEGWDVLNLRDTAWYAHNAFGVTCDLEGEPRFARLGVEDAYTGSREWHPSELADPALPWT